MQKTQKSKPRKVHVADSHVLIHAYRQRIKLDSYHFVFSLSWPQFLVLVVSFFMLINAVFAALYWLLPGSVNNIVNGSFIDYFFFSIETFATVGYGVMSPASVGAHIIASVEILTGMLSVAIITGLVFARFAKPTARFLFSEQLVFGRFEEQPALMLRVANERHNRIVEANATLSLILETTNARGESFFRIQDLQLLRDRSPVFSLSWTLAHPIDEHSPFYGLDSAQLAALRARIIVSVTGHDETMSAAVYAGHTYQMQDVVMGGRFANILTINEAGERMIDLTRFHDIEDLID